MTKAEYTRTWRQKNKDKFKQQEKDYYLKNKESILEVKAKYEKNRINTDVNYKLRKRLRSRLAIAIKANVSAVKDLGCSISELKSYLETKFQTGMTWDNWGVGEGKWQIDHIKPLCQFDLTDKSQQLNAVHYTNLQPLWYREHLAKTQLDSNHSLSNSCISKHSKS